MKPETRPLKTVKCIAHELGVSGATVRRMAKAGVLPVSKSGCGGRTSAYEIAREDLARMKKKG